jgi:NADPH:quinone reductase-like Zn-dependent oxidoreductase
MRAIAISEFGGAERLHVTDLPDPLVGPDTVRLRVHAAGVNPVDYKMCHGNLAGRFPHFFPLIPGWDAAGVVEAVGPAVVGFEPGDEVYGYFRKDYVRDGTYAELATMRDSALAPKPATLSFEEAGAIPLAGLTALQVLRDALDLQGGDRLLVLGASGGVGGFAVQIAKAGGTHVIAVASAANHDYMRGLGADEVIDYGAQDVVEAVRAAHPDGIEAVADFAGGLAQERTATALAPGRGRFASIVQPPDRGAFAAQGIDARYIFVRPDGPGLRTLAAMADAGELRVHLADVIPLEEAARAHEQMQTGHTRGKIVLRV